MEEKGPISLSFIQRASQLKTIPNNNWSSDDQKAAFMLVGWWGREAGIRERCAERETGERCGIMRVSVRQCYFIEHKYNAVITSVIYMGLTTKYNKVT